MSLVLPMSFLSCDSFCAGLLLGPWMAPRRATGVAAAFGVCDAVASWLGAMGTPLPGALVAAAVLAAGTALILRERGWIVAVPVVLSVDDFLAAGHLSDAAPAGVASFTLALAGLALGRGLMRGVPARAGVAR